MTTLTYFPIRGRAEASRLVLEYVGEKYEDKRVTFEEWPELKNTLPFGQIPYFVDSDVEMPQSNAILRHLGRKNNLYGEGLKQAAQIDVIVDGVEDCFVGMLKTIDEKFHGGDRSATEAHVSKWLDIFAGMLKGDDYFVGNKLSIADFTMFNVLDNFVRPLFGSLLEKNESVENFRKRIAALPNVAAYLASDRRPAITMPAFFKVLCTPEECK